MAIDMENNVTYDFVVTAVNNAGEESDIPNEVSVMNGEIINEEVIIDNVSTVAGQAYTGNSSGSGGGCFILTANGSR